MSLIHNGMIASKLVKAKLDVYNVCQTGPILTLIKPGTKDEFGTITGGEQTEELHSFPTRFSPFDREVTQKISWALNTDVIFYIPKLEIENEEISVKEIQNSYKECKFDNKRYDIRYVEPYNPFGTDFLYIIIGGKS